MIRPSNPSRFSLIYIFFLGLSSLFLLTFCDSEQQSKIVQQPADLPSPHLRRAPTQSTSAETQFFGTIGNDSVAIILTTVDSTITGQAIYVERNDTFQLRGSTSFRPKEPLMIQMYKDEMIQGLFRGPMPSSTSWHGEWQHNPEDRVQLFSFSSDQAAYTFLPNNHTVKIKRRNLELASPDQSCRLVFDYPVFSKSTQSPSFHTLNRHLKPPKMTALSQQLASCLAENNEMLDGYTRTEHTSYTIHLMSEKLVSISLLTTITQDNGEQLIETSSATSHTFNPADGSKWTQSDLFVSDFETELVGMIQAHLQKNYGSDWGVAFDTISPDQDMEFHRHHLVVAFDSEELGPFATGRIRIPFWYSDIKHLLRPEGPLFSML